MDEQSAVRVQSDRGGGKRDRVVYSGSTSWRISARHQSQPAVVETRDGFNGEARTLAYCRRLDASVSSLEDSRPSSALAARMSMIDGGNELKMRSEWALNWSRNWFWNWFWN